MFACLFWSYFQQLRRNFSLRNLHVGEWSGTIGDISISAAISVKETTGLRTRFNLGFKHCNQHRGAAVANSRDSPAHLFTSPDV